MPEILRHRLGRGLSGSLADSERGRHGVGNEVGALDRCKVHEHHAVVVLVRGSGGDRDREAGLPATAWSGECDEPFARQRRYDVVDLSVTADEARRSARQIDARLRARQGREVSDELGMRQLEQALRTTQIAEPVLSEIA